jgi:glycosyltransferase involved in cell wall biosynthesis
VVGRRAEQGGDMKTPLLSVTVNNYNYGRYLGQTIKSIQRQTFDDFELILIDNASSDDSLDVMHRYASADPRLRIVAHAQNEGMFASLRESCELSRGRYRVPVEADDWVLAPDAFEVQVDMLERHPSMAFVYSSLTMMGSDGSVHHMSRPYEADTVLAGEDAVEDILSFALTHTGMMMRMDALRATDGYGENFPHVIDMLLGVRLCEVGDVGYIDRPLYAFRQHDTNLHLRPQVKVVEREVLPVIDAAFSGPIPSRLPDAPAVRKRVTRRALVHLSTQYIFVGELRTGWRLYWESCKAEPVATVAQPRTLSLVSRSVLGARGHEWVESRLRRLRGGAPTAVHRRCQRPEPDRCSAGQGEADGSR